METETEIEDGTEGEPLLMFVYLCFFKTFNNIIFNWILDN